MKKIRKNKSEFLRQNQRFLYYSIYNLRTEEEARVTSMGRRSFIFWLTAVLCWINDRLYCEIWSSIGFPYLHGFWHVLIFLAAYTAVVLFAYFDVKQNHPHETPLIQYWPIDSFELGIPYCQLKSYHLNKKEHHIWKVSKKNLNIINQIQNFCQSLLVQFYIFHRCFFKDIETQCLKITTKCHIILKKKFAIL